MEPEIERVMTSLSSRHIHASYAEDEEEARKKILALIPMDSTVGIGDSTAVRQIGVLPILQERGNRILNPYIPKGDSIDPEAFREWRWEMLREATTCNVFLTGTNALTQDGRLVNVDAQGNRVAGMFWGHPLSILVVGRNKIVPNLDEALNRIRKVIAPQHFYIRTTLLGGRKRETPCVATGQCCDCRSVDRGCNIFTIIEGKPSRTEIHVVIVNRDLGLGWDPSWPKERIDRIRFEYRKFVWIPV